MRVAIIGTGWGARVQVPAFRAAGVDVVAIAGSNYEKTKKVAAEQALEPFERWQDLVESDVDLITIVTPPSHHREMAVASLRSGKHVVSEKPTAMNAAEAEEMVRVASAHPRQVALIDHELRFLPAWREAKRRIGELGEIRFVECRYSSPSRGDAARAWSWWSDAAQGGGVLGAIGSHLVDGVRHFAGDVAEVQAELRTFVAQRPDGDQQRAVTSDDYAALNLRLASGAAVSMLMSVVSASDEPTTITIHGSRGGFRFVGAGLEMSQSGGAFEQVRVDDEGKPATIADTPGGAFATGTYYLGRALRAAIDDGDAAALRPGATFVDGLAQQRVLDAARRSGGKWEKVES